MMMTPRFSTPTSTRRRAVGYRILKKLLPLVLASLCFVFLGDFPSIGSLDKVTSRRSHLSEEVGALRTSDASIRSPEEPEDKPQVETVAEEANGSVKDTEDDHSNEQKDKETVAESFKLVLSTASRDLSGQPAPMAIRVKFHLHCLAEIAMLRKHVRVVVYTADDEIKQYVERQSLPLQVVVIPKKNERDFNLFLESMPQLHPNSENYAFTNGDVCPSLAFIDQSLSLMSANCSSSSVDWRFSTTKRRDVVPSDETTDTLLAAVNDRRTQDALKELDHDEYHVWGVDVFVWNRDIFLNHVLPTMPKFSMPLMAADHYLMEDAACNADLLLLAPTHVFHIPHRGVLKVENEYGTDESVVYDNFATRDAVDRSSWKKPSANHRPQNSPDYCQVQADGTFLCQKKSVTCVSA